MSARNKVAWSEGLFLQPQHLQQQERYFEHYVETRCRALVSHAWGLALFAVDRDLLGIGKFAVRLASGVLNDGTPVNIPDDDPTPVPLDIGPQVRGQIVFLAIPVRRSQSRDIERHAGEEELARHQLSEVELRDAASASTATAPVELAPLRTRLLLEADITAAYSCIPLARIVECRADRQVVLDDAFIPTVLHVRAAERLKAFVPYLLGLLRQRGDALGTRVVASGRGSAAEIADFLMLQVINRLEPIVAHHESDPALHPEVLYQLCASAAGELATFTLASKRAPSFPAYRHERLQESFDPVIAALRAALSNDLPQTAIPIPVEARRFGISVALVPDPTLFRTAVFILAARADMPMEELRRRFPAQLKIGPVETISRLVNLALPGVPVNPIPVAPRQIPFHAGFAYFELDQTHAMWAQLTTSGGIALFVAGEFPSLTLEFWAIRSS